MKARMERDTDSPRNGEEVKELQMVDHHNDEPSLNEVLDKMEQNDQRKNESEQDGRLYREMSNNRWTAVILKTFPRTCVMLLGVVVPLLGLIVLSLFFGIILARLEAPTEVESNDDILAKRLIVRRAEQLVTNLTVAIPHVCLIAFLTGTEVEPFSAELVNMINEDPKQILKDNFDLFIERSKETNYTEAYESVVACGRASKTFADALYKNAREEVGDSLAEMSFNWIRCYPGAHDLNVDISSGILDRKERSPHIQSAYYQLVWMSNFYELFDQYTEESNATTLDELYQASTRALEDATGGNACYLNGSGSAWFWFTVQTTIGYGNQSPTTEGGRALVYTVGFVCILAFAGVLATTGNIMLALLDNSVRQRPSLVFVTKPTWGCLFWGSLWYTWMALIAFVTKKWKDNRLSEGFSMKDGYWFAYISTTTVGLGDFFLEPEVIVGIDLLYFPLLILMGFTFLSAFLGKLSALVEGLLKGSKRSFVASILEHMDDRDKSLNVSSSTENDGTKDED
ncbi:hypothetical protein ACA910_005269 [Epithemia clementina (nom. ined.)]